MGDSRVLQARDDSSDSFGEKKSGLGRIFKKAPRGGLVGYALAAPLTTVPFVALLMTYPQSIARATIFW